MGFVNVCVVDQVEENTKEFGTRKEFAASNNLYEVKTLATVAPDQNDSENVAPDAAIDSPIPSVLSASNGKWLAVAVEGDVNLFSVEFDTTLEYSHSLPVGATILAICWLGESSCLAFLTSTHELFIVSAQLGATIFTARLAGNDEVQLRKGTLASRVDGDECVLFCMDNSGKTSIFRFACWTELESKKVEDLNEVLTKCFSNAVRSTSVSDVMLNDVILLPGNHEMIGLGDSGNSLLVSNENTVHFSPLCDNSEHKFVRVQESSSGRFVVGVTADGLMVVRDMWTFCIVAEKTIQPPEDGRVLDFMLIDQSEIEFNHIHIGVVVMTDVGVELQVRDISTLEVVYAVCVRDGTTLIPVSRQSDRVMLLVEPFSKKSNWLDDSVCVREISESKPERRLARLISRNQLDEAEQFAKQFGLDLQQVYVARMEFLLGESYSDSTPEVFQKLLKSMESVTDHNLVGETCYSGASTFQQYDRIISLLAHANKRAISDPDTTDRLARLSYVLATYRLVMGPEDANYKDPLWEAFVEGIEGAGQWYLVFNTFIVEGKIREARMVWHRHGNYIREELLLPNGEDNTFPQLTDLFAKLNKAVNDYVDIWRDILEFLEFDVMPACFPSAVDLLCPMLVDFLKSLARLLEMCAPEQFPDNALHTASTFERVIKKMTDDAITPTRQALLAMIGVGTSSRNATDIMATAENLRVIKRLKDVYQCPLSYQTFTSLTPETICYRILSKAIENPNLVRANVAKLARPYMDEYRLDPDQTLFGYIEDVSKQSKGVVSASNPWDEQCLLVSETIEKFPLKCRAIIMIARGAHPPWSKKLSDAVHAVLNNPYTDADVVSQLRRTCLMAELGLILSSYGVQIALLDSVLSSERLFIKFIRYVLKQKESHAEDSKRLSAALKCVEIYRNLEGNESCIVTKKYVYVLFGEYLQKSVDHDDKALIRFLASIDEERQCVSREEVAAAIVDNLLTHVDSPVTFADQLSILCRVKKMTTSESLIQRYLVDIPKYKEYYAQLVAVRKLQEKYGMWVTRQELMNETRRKMLLREFIRKSKRSLTEIYMYASALTLSRDEACDVALQITLKDSNIAGALAVMREAMLAIPHPSPSLAQSCVNACALVLNALPAVCPEGCDVDVIETVIDHIINLRLVLSDLISCTEHSIHLYEAVIRMSGYAEIFANMVDQCMIEDGDRKVDSEEANSTAPNIGLIFGMSRRVGVYRMCDDGPLVSRMDAVPLFCAVAPSVATDTESMTDAVRNDFNNEQLNRWNSLFDFLTLENQDLLCYFCRVYSASLDCGLDMRPSLSHGLHNSIRNVCERAIQMHPCDLWSTCALIASLAPPEFAQIMKDLRLWVMTRKAPQTMINFLRTTQFMAIHNETRDHYKMLTDSFIKSLWSKRLGKAGVSPQLTKQPIQVAIAEFAKTRLNPEMVAQYVDQFCGSGAVSSELLNYASVLLEKASDETDAVKCATILQCVDQALILSPVSNDVAFDRFRDILYTMCPYNYQVIHFVVTRLGKWVGVAEDDQKFVAGCQCVLENLSDTKRKSAVCKQEINWYMKHCKLLSRVKKDTDGGSKWEKKHASTGSRMRECYEDGTGTCSLDISTVSGVDDTPLQYEREDMMVSSLPARGENVLPFHPFLFQSRGDIESYLIPIIDAEVTVASVLVWQTSIRAVPWLRASCAFPRSLLLSSAVIKKCKEVTDKDDELSTVDVASVRSLLAASTRDAVVSCIANCFKKIPLSDTKISVLRMGVEVAQSWLDDPNTQPPLEPEERAHMEDHIKRLDETIHKYRTELLLKKAGLYDSKTADLVETPFELISHLYTHAVNWMDSADIANKTSLISELSSVNSTVCLLSIQSELVIRWLPDDDQSATTAYAVDLNDTMGGDPMPLAGGGSAPDENEIYLLPFFDSSVLRIVHLLRLIRNVDPSRLQQLMMQLLNSYVKKGKDSSSVTGGFKTIIRAACVLLRAFSEEELAVAKSSHEKLFVEIECTQYGRLLELAREDMSMQQFKKSDKHTLTKALLHPTKRHTPQLFHLAACLVIDHSITDRSLVDTLLNKLYSARKREMLVALLKHCKNETGLHGVKNLALFWARSFDQSIAVMDTSSPQQCEMRRSWLYYCLSCPVSGGRAFEGIQSSLKAQGCPLTTQLVAIVTNFTQRTKSVAPGSGENELCFNWCATPNTISESSMEEDTLSF